MNWALIAEVFYAIASIITFIAFAIDKAAAVRDRRRIPESTLHIMELLCGWPGAWLAIFLLRHKNRKLSFLAITAAISFLHVIVVAVFAGRFR